MADIHQVQGYTRCRACSTWTVCEIAARTGGVCGTCFAGGSGVDLRRVEIVGRGYRLRVPMRRPQKHRPGQPKHPDHHKAERAKAAALKRLKAIFPDLYDTLVAEERARVGLAPWPIVTAVRHSWDPDASETLRFAEVYHALDQRGDDDG